MKQKVIKARQTCIDRLQEILTPHDIILTKAFLLVADTFYLPKNPKGYEWQTEEGKKMPIARDYSFIQLSRISTFLQVYTTPKSYHCSTRSQNSGLIPLSTGHFNIYKSEVHWDTGLGSVIQKKFLLMTFRWNVQKDHHGMLCPSFLTSHKRSRTGRC